MKKYFTLLLLIAYALFSSAQNDSLVLINGNIIVGEAKTMDKGVITMETSYSDSDFKIEWEGIKELYIYTRYNISFQNGERHIGSLRSGPDGKVYVIEGDSSIEVNPNEIVYLRAVDDHFWGNVTAYIDLGFSISQANNLQQFQTRSFVGYLADNFTIEGAYNTLNSTQNDVDPIRRTDGNVNFNYFLVSDWYWLIQAEFLSNTEQLLDLRSTLKTGAGNYLLRSNSAFWRVQIGAAYNIEKFDAPSGGEADPDKRSWEGFLGTTLNLYDIGDFSLLTGANLYPGITEKGRIRGDFNIDLKYDLPLDFYVGAGYRINYDNQPATDAPNTDWVFQTTFGWEF